MYAFPVLALYVDASVDSPFLASSLGFIPVLHVLMSKYVGLCGLYVVFIGWTLLPLLRCVFLQVLLCS